MTVTVAAPSVARSSLTMFGGSVASRVLGVVRNGLITAIIGTTVAGDAFSIANTLPNVLYVLAAGGVLNAVLIPSLARAMKLEDGGQEFTDRVITIALTGMALITVAVMAGAGGFVWLLAGSRDNDFKTLAVAFSLVCLPQIFFYGLFALLGQILNARGRFGAFAWAPFMANVIAVAGLLLFIVLFPKPALVGPDGLPRPRDPSEWTGPMIWLFAGSATLSVVVQALWLVPALRGTGFHYRPRWGVRGVGLGGVSRLALWAFAGLAISQLGFFISQGALNNAVGPMDPNNLDSPLRGPSVSGVAFTLFMRARHGGGHGARPPGRLAAQPRHRPEIGRRGRRRAGHHDPRTHPLRHRPALLPHVLRARGRPAHRDHAGAADGHERDRRDHHARHRADLGHRRDGVRTDDR